MIISYVSDNFLDADVRDTNMVLMREMMLMAQQNGLEFTHEI
jgi:hypothetical protein